MKKHIAIGILSIFTILLLSISVLAAPGVPHQFYGTVTVNGDSAPNNLFVEARVGGNIYSTVTSNGQYGYDLIFYVEDPNNNREGSTIRFFVGTEPGNMVEAASRTFSNGATTRHDLNVSGLVLPPPPSNGGGGGTGGSTGGGGGGSGGSPSTTSTDDEDVSVTVEECVPQWVCSEWTECANNQQRRVCVDRNECGSDEGRPEERRACEMTEEELFGAAPGEEPQEAGFLNWLTGFVTGAGAAAPWIGLIILLALIAGLYLFVFSRKK